VRCDGSHTSSMSQMDAPCEPDTCSLPSPAARHRGEGLPRPPCVYAVSDLHTDMRENMDAILGWPQRPNDILLVAGDVSHNLAVFRATLEAITTKFGQVFFCPGNHDLWLHKDDGCRNSLEKLQKIEALCHDFGVHTKSKTISGIQIVPLYSWYHASFDSEADVSDTDLMPVEQAMMDFHLCKWSDGLTPFDGSDSIARFMDGLNEDVLQEATPSSDENSVHGPVISFSHFLPRPELLPEKRTLFYPHLAKAAGSLFLGERVRSLNPSLHVFGHTHYGWATTLDGIRFMQACLAYPRERAERPFSVLCSTPSGEEAPPPLLAYDHNQQRFPSYKGFWSEYYKVQARCPGDIRWIYRGGRKRNAVLSALRCIVEAGARRVDDDVITEQLSIQACRQADAYTPR